MSPGSARAEVLARVRAATAEAPAAPEVGRGYRRLTTLSRDEVLDLFVARVGDYRARVVPCAEADVVATVDGLLEGEPVVVPPGLPWELGSPTVVDDPAAPMSAADLDAAYAVVTAARVGIAETGTIVLDHGPDQGRRALTLVPDRHVCVVRADQVVPGVPDAMGRLDPARPQTWVSGPSATSDIELSRVEGVHGPRTLLVVLVR